MANTSDMGYEAAIVALVPEAEPLVGQFRERYDPSAPVGMPAHITINYPFTPRPIPDDLKELFLGFRYFEFVFSRIERWPDVLYLSPEPSAPFKELIEYVALCFPDSPPYEGRFAVVIPHLTVAHSSAPEVLAQVAEDFSLVAEGRLPVSSRLEELWLMDNQTGRWEKRLRLPLSA